MTKTLALFFILGVMISCASHHGERSISSYDEKQKDSPQHFPRFEPRLVR
ncbi:MAG: hypothetical protein AB7I27_15945 [Bacteriovoracaceae bacterium]